MKSQYLSSRLRSDVHISFGHRPAVVVVVADELLSVRMNAKKLVFFLAVLITGILLIIGLYTKQMERNLYAGEGFVLQSRHHVGISNSELKELTQFYCFLFP